MPRLELFPFRHRDAVTGKWVKARYLAERQEIAARYAEWEIIGPPEIRDVDPHARYFTPWKVVSHAELMGMEERPPELQPHVCERPHRRTRSVLDGAVSSKVRHILREAKAIFTDARCRTITFAA